MMHVVTQTLPRLCKGDGLETARAVALAEIDTHIDNLKRCLHWLIAAGVSVISVDMNRGTDQPLITVSASDSLHQLFGEDCAFGGRRRENSLIVDTWLAQRHGCTIRWQEVEA